MPLLHNISYLKFSIQDIGTHLPVFLFLYRGGGDLMLKKLIDEILADIGLESLEADDEEDEETWQNQPTKH